MLAKKKTKTVTKKNNKAISKRKNTTKKKVATKKQSITKKKATIRKHVIAKKKASTRKKAISAISKQNNGTLTKEHILAIKQLKADTNAVAKAEVSLNDAEKKLASAKDRMKNTKTVASKNILERAKKRFSQSKENLAIKKMMIRETLKEIRSYEKEAKEKKIMMDKKKKAMEEYGKKWEKDYIKKLKSRKKKASINARLRKINKSKSSTSAESLREELNKI